MTPDRRSFLKTLGAAGAALSAPAFAQTPAAPAAVSLGVDMFSVNAQNWTPFQQLDFAKKWNVKVVHFSEIRQIGSLDPEHLRKVRAHADQLGIDLEIGMRSICPTSTSFDKAAGTAQEQLGRMLDAARIVRSPIVRAFLGSSADRKSGIEKHIAETVNVLKSMRSRIVDAGLKIAIENHAGDMQARELKTLVEGAGPDYVGVCIDSGNPVWTIEDPHLTLETLAPYVLTSHMRDSAVWKTPEGIATRWTRMGEGTIGMEQYLRNYIAKCPGKPVSLEIIVTGQPRMFNYANPDAWALYRNQPAWEFARFLALAEKGSPSTEPAADPATTPVARNLQNVEASIRWTQAFLARL